jgi:hypothetical protein
VILLCILAAYCLFAIIAICMFFNWISTGDPYQWPGQTTAPTTPSPDVERQRTYKPDEIRVERGDWSRAGGDVRCGVCDCVYYDHPSVIGYSWLRRTCTGKLVKL